MTEIINSLQNPKIKHIVKLRKASERREHAEFIIEGIKEIEMAMRSDFEFLQVFYNSELLEKNKRFDLIEALKKRCNIYSVSSQAFAKIAYREESGGVLVVARSKSLSLNALSLGERPLVLVVESVEKPGNMGAMLRTADAANIDAIIVCDPLTDIYNPNLIRASLGCVFTLPIAVCGSGEALEFLQKNGINIYAATLQCEKHYFDVDFSMATAFVMGTEADGLSEFWRKNALSEVKIPMMGLTDSLNVSAAAAILMFEALRQRISTSD